MKKLAVFFIGILLVSLVAPIPTGPAQAKVSSQQPLSQLPLGLEPAYLAAVGAKHPLTANEKGLQAEGGGLQGTFSSTGLTLAPAADDGGWTWGIALAAWGAARRPRRCPRPVSPQK